MISALTIDRRLSIAPMLDWTDRHERFFLRLLSKHVVLYTEMITTGALIHGDSERFLAHHIHEQPLALQLGGSNALELVQCSKMAEAAGYSEINLNIGCPSDRVQSGRFGACLMAQPQQVADCIAKMKNAVSIPVTIKCRIGIDDQDSYEFLVNFIQQTASAGCKTFIIHARKAILSGLSPKQNREIPPLNYPRVYSIKKDFPELSISINGGIKSLNETLDHLDHVDGVMIGREAYHHPGFLLDADNRIFNKGYPQKTKLNVLQSLLPYIENEMSKGVQIKSITRHILGLFHGEPGAKAWRRHLSTQAYKEGSGIEVIKEAAKHLALNL